MGFEARSARTSTSEKPWHSPEGIDILPVYGPEHLAGLDVIGLDPTFPLTNAVKGMLQRNTLGADMLTRLRVYAGAEHGHQAQKPKALSFDEKGGLKIG